MRECPTCHQEIKNEEAHMDVVGCLRAADVRLTAVEVILKNLLDKNPGLG